MKRCGSRHGLAHYRVLTTCWRAGREPAVCLSGRDGRRQEMRRAHAVYLSAARPDNAAGVFAGGSGKALRWR
ncbi:hypothetical protein KCP75_01340 [Salmonella enterica subsp. enterica]|nr:hypothetical protein KCP75_01340 [Salmonella enterica subsp. enterica]